MTPALQTAAPGPWKTSASPQLWPGSTLPSFGARTCTPTYLLATSTGSKEAAAALAPHLVDLSIVTYIFCRYDEARRAIVAGYPAHVRAWRGVPGGLDSVLTWRDGQWWGAGSLVCLRSHLLLQVRSLLEV